MFQAPPRLTLVSLPLFAVAMVLLGLVGCGETPQPNPPTRSSMIDDLLSESDSSPTETKTLDVGFRFETVTDAGITFEHHSGNSDVRPFPAANGSGVGVIDLDLDGLADLYFADGTPIIAAAKVQQAAKSSATELSFQAVDKDLSIKEGDLFSLGGFLYQSGSTVEIPANESSTVTLGVPHASQQGVIHDRLQSDVAAETEITFFPEFQKSGRADQLYRNLGRFHFQNVSQTAGVHWEGYSAGVAVGDYNSDGFPDLYVNCFGNNRLYENQGDGTFMDVTARSLSDDPRWGSSAVFVDYNQDGLLDLYVGNYAIWDLSLNQHCRAANPQERIFCSPLSVNPVADRLLVNLGDGTFGDDSQKSGILSRTSRTQGVLAGNFDSEDGPDLYLGNDMHPNSLFINTQGTFADLTDQSGMGYDSMGRSQAGMGLAAADVDQNGSLEVFVTNYAGENNAFYELIRKNGYSEASSARGLSSDSVQWVGWGTAFVDIDMDQWVDLVVTNGHTDHNKPNEAYLQPCLAWQNQKGRFVLTGASNGDYFSESHLGRGLALADLDNDGDWDLVFAHLNHAPAILRNDTPRKMGTLSLELEGRSINRDAIACRVTVTQGDKSLDYHVMGGGSYLSTHQNRLILPVDPQTPVQLTVHWTPELDQQISLTPQQLASGQLVHLQQP